MGVNPTRRRVTRAFCLFLLATCSCSLLLFGQKVPACKGPAELERAISSHPSAGAYNALGAYFGQQRQFSCAVSAFESALRLEPKSWEAHYNLALTYLEKGSAEKAVRELRIALPLRSDTPLTNVALGTALRQLNQLDEAVAQFKTALTKEPQSVPALDGLTKTLIDQKRYAAAITYLQNAPSNEALQLNLAIAHSKSGNTAEALQILSRMVKEQPSSAQAHSNLGIVYTQQGRYREATDEFREALQLDPSDDVVRLSYVKALGVLAEFQLALPIIREYTARKPKEFEGLYLMGVIDRGAGNYAHAETVLRRAIALNPNHYDVRYNLGFVLARLGRPAEARRQLERALQLNPNSSEAQFQMAGVLRTLGEREKAQEELKVFEQRKQESVKQNVAATRANQANDALRAGDVQHAVELYREAIAQDPKNGRTYYDLALALDRLGDRNSERDALEKAVALDSTFAPPHNQLGFLSLEAGQAADAEQQFKAAIALDPQYAEAQNNLGVLYGQQGKNKAAEGLFRQATENNPQYAQAFVNLGLTLAGQSRFADADGVLQSALKIEPKNTKALTARAMVLTRLSRPSEAIENFREVVELDPTSAGAHLNLGIAMADQFNLEGALAQFSEAVRLDPNSSAPHYNKGRVLLDLQRNQEATPELEAAVRIDPNAADSLYLLGLIEKQSGNNDESIRLLERVVQLEPNNCDALYKLGQSLSRKGDNAGAIVRWRRVIEINPEYGEALYNLSRLLAASEPDEANRLQARFVSLQEKQHAMDRAQTLGNFALASAAAHDFPQAISQLKEGLQICGECTAGLLLHKNLGLIYCRSGDLKNGRAQLLEARKLAPDDPDIEQALRILEVAKP